MSEGDVKVLWWALALCLSGVLVFVVAAGNSAAHIRASAAPPTRAFYEAQEAQGRLDSMVPACRDHVQYLIAPYSNSPVFAPHFKPDGHLYTC